MDLLNNKSNKWNSSFIAVVFIIANPKQRRYVILFFTFYTIYTWRRAVSLGQLSLLIGRECNNNTPVSILYILFCIIVYLCIAISLVNNDEYNRPTSLRRPSLLTYFN